MAGQVEPVGVAVAGLGRPGMFHLERLGLREDCRVLAAWDPDPWLRERAAGLPCIARDWQDLLEDPQIELVVIAVPPPARAPLAQQMLQAGRHVLIDPPIGVTVAQSAALLSASEKSGKSISVAQLRRWDSDFLTAHSEIARGGMGRLKLIRKIVWQFNPPRSAEDGSIATDRLSATDAASGETATATMPSSPATSAAPLPDRGVLWEFGPHCFDQLLQLAGEPPASVYATCAGARTAACGADAFLALVNFPSGLAGHLEFSRTALAPLDTGWMVSGEHGGYANFTRYSATSEGEVVDEPLTAPALTLDQLYADLVGHVRRGTPLPCPASDAQRVVALLEATVQSASTGSVVHL